MPSEDLQWIDITDFTPGLYEPVNRRDSSIKATNAPDGAADAAVTFGCVAAADGGLIGLPRATAVTELDATTLQSLQYTVEDVWRTATCEAPTDPPLVDTRLMDFDVMRAEESFQRPRNDSSIDTVFDFPQDTLESTLGNTYQEGRMFASIWQCYGVDNSGEDVVFYGDGGNQPSRSTGLEYKANIVKMFHQNDGEAATVYVGATPAVYWSPTTATYKFLGESIDASQKRYGKGEINGLLFL